MHVVEPDTFLVNAGTRLVFCVLRVGIVFEEILEHDAVGVAATDRERIAYDGPLRLAIKAKNFSEVVNETCENKPARLSIATNLLRGLQQVFELRHVRVRVAV